MCERRVGERLQLSQAAGILYVVPHPTGLWTLRRDAAGMCPAEHLGPLPA
jgi:hypothetical protein